jgi:hypothetical protein
MHILHACVLVLETRYHVKRECYPTRGRVHLQATTRVAHLHPHPYSACPTVSNIAYVSCGDMSMLSLPKELRLNIWALAYFSQPPRLVSLRTRLHDEAHDEETYCPRYSPTAAPTVVNTCREARAEAYYQARKAGHLVRLDHGPLFVASTVEFYFRFETDILFLPFNDGYVRHFDDSPEVGLLRHFRRAVDCNASSLRNVAVTKVISSGYYDGSLMNCLREFPDISRLVMMVPGEVWQDDAQKSMFVRASLRILRMYELDIRLQSHTGKVARVSVDFATLVRGELGYVPKEIWKDWSDAGWELSQRPIRSDDMSRFYSLANSD